MESERRIVRAIRGSYREAYKQSKLDPSVGARPLGLRFNELKDKTELHRDTLARRLRSMRKEGKVVLSETGLYNVGSPADRDLVLSNLLLLIEELGPGYVSTGGPMSDSIHPEEKAVIRSTTLFALPALPLAWLGDLLRRFHANLAAQEVLSACEAANVRLEELDTTGRRTEILEALKRGRLRGKQILVWVVDWDAWKGELTDAYVRRIARTARALQRRGRA